MGGLVGSDSSSRIMNEHSSYSTSRNSWQKFSKTDAHKTKWIEARGREKTELWKGRKHFGCMRSTRNEGHVLNTLKLLNLYVLLEANTKLIKTTMLLIIFLNFVVCATLRNWHSFRPIKYQ
jgi:ribosomal protein S4